MEDFMKFLAPKYWPPGQRVGYAHLPVNDDGVACTMKNGKGSFKYSKVTWQYVRTSSLKISAFTCVWQAWNFIFERARPFVFCKGHLHWKTLKSMGNFWRGTKMKFQACHTPGQHIDHGLRGILYFQACNFVFLCGQKLRLQGNEWQFFVFLWTWESWEVVFNKALDIKEILA